MSSFAFSSSPFSFLLFFLFWVSLSLSSEFNATNFCNETPASSRSLWENYLCETITTENIDEACFPIYRKTSNRTLKGLVVIFHGYTACPDSFDPLANYLQSNGYHVLSFLTPGHGRVFNDCLSMDAECVNGDPVENLPIKSQPYIDFIQTANTIVEDEKKKLQLGSNQVVAAIGLSLGGPLASMAVSESAQKKLYNQAIIFNGFFGMTVPDLDRKLTACEQNATTCKEEFVTFLLDSLLKQFGDDNSTQENIESFSKNLVTFLDILLQDSIESGKLRGGYAQLQSLLRFGMAKFVENPSLFPQDIRNSLESPFGWGEACYYQRDVGGRKGYCSFKVKHLLAAHSFAQTALRNTQNVRDAKIQYVLVQRDGITRNSLIFQGAQTIAEYTTKPSACIYRVDPTCSGTGNECGVPHSMMSRAENSLTPPYKLYWESTVLTQTLQLLDKDIQQMGSPITPSVDIAVCSQQDISNPDSQFIGDIPKFVQIILDTTLDKLTDAAKNRIIESIANETGISEYWLVNILQVTETLSEKVQTEMEMSPQILSTLVRGVEEGSIKTLNGFDIEEVRVGKTSYKPPSPEEDSEASSLQVFLMFIWAMIALCTLY